MRLNLNLKGVKISPVCHIQLNRQAEEQRGKLTIGQIYGALYEDEAHVTNILPYPDEDNMSSKEELEAMDRRHEDMCKEYNLDSTNIGWYAVSFKQNVWEQVEIVQYFEKKDNASFFLVYDYEARLIGKNPYKAFRLKDEFALKENFSLSDLSEAEISKPFIEIPVHVQKNEIFETLMVFNKKQLLKEFEKNGSLKETKDVLKDKVQSYIQTLEEQAENNMSLFEKRSKESNSISFAEYCQNLGIILKAQEQEKDLRKYEENINKIKNVIGNE